MHKLLINYIRRSTGSKMSSSATRRTSEELESDSPGHGWKIESARIIKDPNPGRYVKLGGNADEKTSI